MNDFTKLRNEIVKEIISKNPDSPVIFLDIKNDKRWPQEKKITTLTSEEKVQFNLRKQFPDEIVLDIEEKYLFDSIRVKLEDRNWSYKVWDTGSRGLHVSIRFNNLANQTQEVRERIRKYEISYFKTDMKMNKDNQWLAMEWSPHIKTSNVKRLIDFVNTPNPNLIDENTIIYCKQQIENEEKRKIENKEIVKDFHKTDPYLKYAMETTLDQPNQDKNNVLFKNLAIGLVKSGLPRDQIVPYAQNVIEHCPGHNVGEFMGWVDKALSGILTDYNKTELIQWSKQHDHPILYKMYSDEELIDFMSIKQLWDEIWHNTITSQEVWKDLCFYNLLGTVLQEKEDDLRIHVIFSSYSSTGKDEGINIIRDILERMEYVTSCPSTITDKTLIGGVNQTSIDFNVKNQLSEDEPQKGTKTYRDPIEKGFLQSTDWMSFAEAEFILKPGVYNRNIQLILRQAMDKARRVDKGVGGYNIKIKTNTSFIMATYTMTNVINSVLHNGLFQRALFYNKELEKNDHENIRLFMSKNSFNGNGKVKFNREKYILKLIQKLRLMKNWYEEHKYQFEYEEGSDQLVNILWKQAEEGYKTFFAEDKDILNSIIRRSLKNLKKLSVLSATWNMNTFITKTNIKDCFSLAVMCVDSVKTLLTKQDKAKKKKYSLLQLIAKGNMTGGMIHAELENTFKMKSPNSRSNFMKQLCDAGYVTKYKSGRSDMYSIVEKGRNYLLIEED